jgi:hypothetical protein
MEGDGNGRWTLGQARSLLRQGYHIRHVVTTTGYGLKWFDDLPLDDYGHGMSTEDWISQTDNHKGKKKP